jgi:prepilin-type N-terminal cleavage/methylation domain-containing protein
MFGGYIAHDIIQINHTMKLDSRRAFTLIELLVVIAIIAVLSVVVILSLNPAELLRQSRDSQRISDLSTLNEVMSLYQEDVFNSSLGTASTSYISISDGSATSSAGDQCQAIGLPSLPSGSVYHCANGINYRNVSSTGWVPVNLNAISAGSPVGNLPVDPTNTSSSGFYYTYETNTSQYEFTAALESQKYQPVAASDGGTYSDLYEKGTSLTLIPIDFKAASTASSSGGPIVYVQSTHNFRVRFTGSSVSKAFTSNNASGDFIIVAAGEWCGGSLGTLTIADSLNNSYNLVAATSGQWLVSSQSASYLWDAANIAGGANTVTVSNTTSSCDLDMAIHEYSGIVTTSPLDINTYSTKFAQNTTTINTGNISTSNANDLLFAFGYDGSDEDSPWTIGSGWTARETTEDTDGTSLQSTDQIVSSTGSYSETFTIPNHSNNFHAQIAAFK